MFEQKYGTRLLLPKGETRLADCLKTYEIRNFQKVPEIPAGHSKDKF